MPTWLPPALGLVVFWGLLALLLRLLFRKSVPADPPFELSVGPDPADVRDMDHTELPGAEDISPRVREAWRALSAPPPRLEPELETAGELCALQAAGIHRAQGFALGHPSTLPVPPVDYTPLPLDALVEQAAGDADPLLWTHVDATVAVTAHGLLSSINAIEGALGLLRRRRQSITDEEYRALVATAERQARHIGGVLKDLMRGLPSESLALLDELAGGEIGADEG